MSTPERHPATAKVWDWFENDEQALTKSDVLRSAIRQRIEEIDAELIAWERIADKDADSTPRSADG